MGVPSPRTPVRIARGTKSVLETNKAAIEEGEICYATDENMCYVKEGSNLVQVTKDYLDEDNMSSNSATQAPTQQSVKAYVDTADATKASLAGATFTGNINAGVDDTGVDVKFFGATAGAYLLWDESDDQLETGGSATIDIVKDKLKIAGTAVTTTAAELNVLDGAGIVTADLSKLNGFTGATADLNFIDVATAGTAEASKAVVLDANKDITGLNDVTIAGDLTVNGTTTTINSTTLSVDDKNIELGSVSSPSDSTADGGGITLKGASDKTILWTNSTDSWDFNQHVNAATGQEFKINNASVLSATTLGSSVVSSSLTSVGTLAGLDTAGFLREAVTVTAGKLSDNLNLDLANGNVFLFTTAESTTATPNIRYNSSTTLNDSMGVGDVASVTIVTTANASGFSAQLTIDGSAVTENWIGGSAPDAGGSSGVDIHAYTIIKTAANTYTVIANHQTTS